jgi:formylglycine-generating enzyme required for sulfatase activity
MPLRPALALLVLVATPGVRAAPEAREHREPRGERVALRGGCFLMGAADGAFCEERPAHPACVDSFEIDVAEVSNAAYGRCVMAGACRPTGWPRSGRLPAPAEPVTHVSWDDATRYCAFAGGRLPTEAEWEYAGRRDGRPYAWGEAPPACADTNFGGWPRWGWRCDGQYWCRHAKACRGRNPGHAEPARSRPRDRSPAGVYDLAGNVAEWVADRFDRAYYRDAPVLRPTGPAGPAGAPRTVRGGSFQGTGWSTRLTGRAPLPPDTRHASVGFRCARDLRRDAPAQAPALGRKGRGCDEPITLAGR